MYVFIPSAGELAGKRKGVVGVQIGKRENMCCRAKPAKIDVRKIFAAIVLIVPEDCPRRRFSSRLLWVENLDRSNLLHAA